MKHYKETCVSQLGFKVWHEMKKIKSELNKYRYFFEKKITCRTEHLIKHIEVLEACNEVLCRKLELYQKQLAAILPDKSSEVLGPSGREEKLYLVNTRIKSVLQKHS